MQRWLRYALAAVDADCAHAKHAKSNEHSGSGLGNRVVRRRAAVASDIASGQLVVINHVVRVENDNMGRRDLTGSVIRENPGVTGKCASSYAQSDARQGMICPVKHLNALVERTESILAPLATTTALSVLGADSDTGESSLTYTWSVTSQPSGAPAPSFSANGTNAAKNSTATFYRAGSYTFQAVITDPSGLTCTSSVSVTVNQTLTSIAVSPPSATLLDGATQQFSATAQDQFNQAMASQPVFVWSIASGIGAVSAAGLYTAPGSGTGSATINAVAGLTGTATVAVTSVPAAPTNLTATAASARRVNLAWSESSSNVTGFNIQRSSNGGSSWSQIAQVSGSTTTYTDTTVNKNRTYQYRVDAYNGAGTSAWSNVATVTTPNRAPVKDQYPEADVPELISDKHEHDKGALLPLPQANPEQTLSTAVTDHPKLFEAKPGDTPQSDNRTDPQVETEHHSTLHQPTDVKLFSVLDLADAFWFKL
jgi:hypothetical protein